MWFNKPRREPVTEEISEYVHNPAFEQAGVSTAAEIEAEHWPSDRMASEENGKYAAWATEDDLNELSDAELGVIANLCKVDTAAPTECIPCLAAVMLAEKYSVQSNAGPGEEGIPFDDPSFAQVPDSQPIQPLADALTRAAQHDMPVAERFAYRVRELETLVQEMLEGPPIPPPNVTLEELSLLAVAAQRWIKITEAQGIDLPPNQQQVLDATKSIVSRLHRG